MHTTTIEIGTALLQLLDDAAGRQGVTLAELLSDIANNEYAKQQEEIAKENYHINTSLH